MIGLLSRHLLALATGAAALCMAGGAAAAGVGTPCEKLTQLTIPNVSIASATLTEAGDFSAADLKKPIRLPAFCRVQGSAHPTPDSDIGFELWIPTEGQWNGKFEGVGTGGYMGSISYDALADGLKRGYAVASTDMGHKGDDLKFGEGHPEKVTDWAYRAIHVTADAGKLITRDNTGRMPSHAYFVGCSSGGHQALSEAQRYPEDYDGIVAGDPGYDRVHQTAAYLWSWLALHDAHGAPLLTASHLELLTRSAIAACDDLDGVKDGVIDDPRRCRFDPAVLTCKPGAATNCLTAEQVAAVKKVYAGLRNPRTGEEIFPGWSLGSEAFGSGALQGWNGFLLSPKQPMRSDVYKYLVFNDPNWSYRNFDFDRDVAYSDAKIGEMAAVDPDLSRFAGRGGKLVMYTGWADPVAAPLDVLKYYEGAVKANGGLSRTQAFYRFFMAPGIGHCGGGYGPNSFDMLAALERWVEHSEAPVRVLASLTTDSVKRTRPLCPYPQVARWTGKGDTHDAANFTCKAAEPPKGR